MRKFLFLLHFLKILFNGYGVLGLLLFCFVFLQHFKDTTLLPSSLHGFWRKVCCYPYICSSGSEYNLFSSLWLPSRFSLCVCFQQFEYDLLETEREGGKQGGRDEAFVAPTDVLRSVVLKILILLLLILNSYDTQLTILKCTVWWYLVY